jgi:hypothetical protein
MSDNGDFGVEGIRYFDKFRAANSWAAKTADLTYTYNITNGVVNTLRDAGYPNNFYWAGEDAWELDLQSTDAGGLDAEMTDDVDLFFINTHGRNDDGVISLAYNSKNDDWIAKSTDWKLGDIDAEWIAIYGCDTIKRDHFWAPYNQIFRGLHLLCGAYDSMYDGITTDEVGEDFADNLMDGDSVASSWIDGVSDWYVDNHPAILSAERSETWGADDAHIWSATTMQLDHYHGRGGVTADIPHDQLGWIGLMWSEG